MAWDLIEYSEGWRWKSFISFFIDST